MFSGLDVFKELDVLSGGERVRLALVKLKLRCPMRIMRQKQDQKLEYPAMTWYNNNQIKPIKDRKENIYVRGEGKCDRRPVRRAYGGD